MKLPLEYADIDDYVKRATVRPRFLSYDNREENAKGFYCILRPFNSISLSFEDSIHNPSVFKLFTFKPDNFLNLSSNQKSLRAEFMSDRTVVVSSAYLRR